MKIRVSVCMLVEGTCLTQLDEFRSNRSEFTAKLAEMKQKVEDQRQQHTDKLASLEDKQERDRQRFVLLMMIMMMTNVCTHMYVNICTEWSKKSDNPVLISR